MVGWNRRGDRLLLLVLVVALLTPAACSTDSTGASGSAVDAASDVAADAVPDTGTPPDDTPGPPDTLEPVDVAGPHDLTESSDTPATPDVPLPGDVQTTPGSKRHVLLIITDDMGIDSTLTYADADGDGVADDGRTYAPIPTIDAICKRGVIFEKAWAYPVCSPTRAAMLTGRFGFRTGVGATVMGASNAIQASEVTIPMLLDQLESGFPAANIGKWHLGVPPALGRDDAPATMGWPHYSGSLSGALPSYTDWSRTVNGKTAPETGYATTVAVDDAVAWLGEQDPEGSWFLWLALNAPHDPYHLPPNDLHSQNLSGEQAHIDQNKADYYRAAVEAADTEIARLLAWIEANEHGPVDIIFVGDNGTPLGAVDPPWDRFRAKGTLYQGGVHVPMCAAGPSVVNGGRTTEALVSVVDIFATVVELAGGDLEKLLPANLTVDSRSLMPILTDEQPGGSRTWTYAEAFGQNVENAGTTLRDARYKLIRNDKGSEELYDLDEDALETEELISQGPLAGAAADAHATLSAQLDALAAQN